MKVNEFLQFHESALEALHAKPTGKWVRLARKRFEHDLIHAEKRGFTFSPKRAQHAVDFFQFLKHSKGQWAGQQFQLEPWQLYDITWPIFGWLREDGTRRFRQAYIEVAKKNGKSTYLAGTGLYLTIGDREPGAEVYSVATKRDQARIIHSEAIRMAQSSSALREYIDVFKNNISMQSLASKYEPLSADADTQDGINVHGALLDELHRWKNRELLDIIEQSTAARLQPLVIAITTAGHSKLIPCWEMRRHATAILEGFETGSYIDDSFFCYIATLDDNDDPFDETNWIKANPNLGVSIRLEEMREKAGRAQKSTAELNAFLRFRLNLWTEQDIRWIEIDRWDQCAEVFPEEALRGVPVYAGLDLSTTRDITALVIAGAVPDTNQIRVLPFFFIPEDTIDERYRRDKVPYPDWVKSGYIIPTPGNVVDYDFIRAKINELGKLYSFQEIAFDPWNATQVATQLGADGFKMVEFRQGFASMNAPSKYFEGLILSKRLKHNANPVLRWMVQNVCAKVDPAGNIKPDKSKSAEKIDGVVATIMALARLGAKTEGRASVYSSRGVITL